MIRSEAIDKNGRHVADIFVGYEKQLKQSGALDFDDLLLRRAKLLRESPAVREKWQARFQYILVDEYQDTNRVQYELLRLLTGPQHNLCVVGDEDQSIYRWRGADVSILLSFSRDFPDAKVIKLERNYRSTQQILNAAGAVVANNPERLGKTLSAENGEGKNLRYFEARDAQAEAEFVAGELERILDDDSSQTCAVEYRTNFQSRAFEEAFRRRGVRYKLVGGFSFYNRAEVKDALAYVRLAHASGRRRFAAACFECAAARALARPPWMRCAKRRARTALRCGPPSENLLPERPAGAQSRHCECSRK